MPLYDYQCSTCGHSCEILHKIDETPQTECPSCHKTELKRQVSAPQFQLKGSGWYVTDFKPGANKSSSSKPSSTAGDSKKEENSSS